MAFILGLREGIKKKTIESLTAVIPTLDPPQTLTALGFVFQGRFLNLLGCWFQSETDFVNILSNFDHENLNYSWTNFDKYKVRG